MKHKNKIKSILIANRGEIAIRIAQTAKKMGIESVGIRTSKEPNAYYLTQVDRILNFPEREINDTPEFLDIECLVLLASGNKIDAIRDTDICRKMPSLQPAVQKKELSLLAPLPVLFKTWVIKSLLKTLPQKVRFLCSEVAVVV